MRNVAQENRLTFERALWQASGKVLFTRFPLVSSCLGLCLWAWGCSGVGKRPVPDSVEGKESRPCGHDRFSGTEQHRSF